MSSPQHTITNLQNIIDYLIFGQLGLSASTGVWLSEYDIVTDLDKSTANRGVPEGTEI